MKQKILIGIWLLSTLFAACGDDDDGTSTKKDAEKPKIVETGIVANPQDCQQYKVGESIPFLYTFTDNEELGNFNIEIHHNFDHHTHGTSATSCPLNPQMTSEEIQKLKVWVYNKSFSIPKATTKYTAKETIEIPKDIAPGDYHFMIRLTDAAGWQELKAMSIKIIK